MRIYQNNLSKYQVRHPNLRCNMLRRESRTYCEFHGFSIISGSDSCNVIVRNVQTKSSHCWWPEGSGLYGEREKVKYR